MEDNEVKKKSKKKIVKVILLILLIIALIILSPLLLVLGSIFSEMLFNRPSTPEIKHAEVPFVLVYEDNGETKKIEDTFVFDYKGTEFSIDGGTKRDWDKYFKNNGNDFRYHIESEIDPEIYIVVPNEPEYYLSMLDFPIDPYISYVCEETGTMYEEADLSEEIGLKIVSWDFEVNSTN